ncbi:MAG: CvpA family protein [Planctomycetes bacterium]|nr:CvpA family protein [Planctomycetota bacterium]
MTWLDIVFIVVLCSAAVLGFWSGLMWQLYGIFCLVLSYFVALLLYSVVAGPFAGGVGEASANTVAYSLVFAVVFILSYGLGLLIKRLLHLRPGKTGRILGLFLGLFEATLVCGLIAVALVDYSSGDVKQLADSSKVVPVFARGARFMSVLIPQDVKNGVGSAREKVEGVKLEDVRGGLKTLKETSEGVINEAKGVIRGEDEGAQQQE